VCAALGEVRQEGRQGGLYLAQQQVVGRGQFFRAAAGVRTAHDNGHGHAVASGHDLLHGLALDQHGGYEHHVGPPHVLGLEGIHIHVHQTQFGRVRQHGGHGDQAQGRHGAAFAQQPQCISKAPVRFGRYRRVNQQYFAQWCGHGVGLRKAWLGGGLELR